MRRLPQEARRSIRRRRSWPGRSRGRFPRRSCRSATMAESERRIRRGSNASAVKAADAAPARSTDGAPHALVAGRAPVGNQAMQSLLLDTPAPETPGRDEAPAAAQQEPAARDRVDEPEGPTATQAGEQTPATQAPAAEAPAAATPLIVEDSGEQPLEPGQARRAEFLTQLQTAVVNTAEEELVGTGWSAANCPWIDQWFAYYATRSAAQIERAIHR